jgi:hypothetical protein
MELKNLMAEMQSIMQLLEANNFESVNDILKSTDPKLGYDIPVMLLRVTYPVRKRLPFYPDLLGMTFLELESRGLYSAYILRGLLVECD